MDAADLDPDCLHCAVSKTIDDFITTHEGRTDRNGDPAVTGETVIHRVMEAAVDFILSFPEVSDRADLVAHAHRELDRMLVERCDMPTIALPGRATEH